MCIVINYRNGFHPAYSLVAQPGPSLIGNQYDIVHTPIKLFLTGIKTDSRPAELNRARGNVDRSKILIIDEQFISFFWGTPDSVEYIKFH